MGGDDEAVRSPVVVVVAGGEVEHRGGQLVGERGAVLGGAEADLGVDGHRGQALARPLGPPGEAADLADHAPGEGDQVAGREPVGGLLGVGRPLAERGRRDDVAGGGGLQHPLGDAAVLALLGQLDEAVRLERAAGGS